MLGDVLNELVASMIGETLTGWLFPSRARAQPPPKEGEWNASLGSIAAFLGGVAAIFGLFSAAAIVREHSDSWSWGFLIVAVVLALIAGILARRTFEVTNRRHILARLGLWLSRVTV